MANPDLATPSRRVLLVVATGGFTHASPVFEIGSVLAKRGHTIEFATLEGQEGWIKGYQFITKVYTLGPAATPEQMNAHYLRMRDWNISKGIGGVMQSKYLWDSFWPQTYHGLKGLIDNPDTRPSMMIADFFVDAVKDIHVEYNLPIAQVWPQMPMLMMPCSYIPGQPGFQLEGTLTSETSTMCNRIRNELVVFYDLPVILKWLQWTKKMRLDNGVKYPVHKIQKPDYLIFINSFFGLEIPRDLPPTCAPVGPLISETYPPLNEECANFLSQHSKVIYIALGTHIILSNSDASKIVRGLLQLIDDGVINGVIWSIGKNGRQDLDPETRYETGKQSTSLGDILSENNPNWLTSYFVPQRAILDHASTKIYFTHGGGSSANEGLFHGKPMLSMGVFSDQIANTARLVYGGVAEALNKFKFTSEELYAKAKKIIEDKDGGYARNSLRLLRIAHVATRRKHYAADLVEELIYDTELRFKDGKELRPMHLQTADMRMPVWKAKNWDLWAVSLVSLGTVFGGLGIGGHILWQHWGSLVQTLRALLGSRELLRNLLN